MDGEHCRVGFGLGWQPADLELAGSVRGCAIADVLGEGCELLALKRLCVASIGVFNDDPRLLDVGDAESLVASGVMSVASSGSSSQRSRSVPHVAPNGGGIPRNTCGRLKTFASSPLAHLMDDTFGARRERLAELTHRKHPLDCIVRYEPS
jgi:hypothetical protein